MPGEQYLALCKQTTRGPVTGTPAYKFIQTLGGWPKFNPTDEPRNEFAGHSTAMGPRSQRRKESAWTASPQMLYRPGEEIGMILRQLFGYAGTRATVDTSGKKGLLYPSTAMPWGAGAPLADESLGLVPNLDEAGTTKSQSYGGFRPTTGTFVFKGTDDVVLTVEGGGAGDWVGAVDQAAIPGVSMPSVDPFNSSEVAYYIGSGAVRTGTAPDFTDISPGTMTRFYPDEATLKILNGITDVVTGNGVKGPSKSKRTAQESAEFEFKIDYEDPSSGFSSADECKRIFSGPVTNSILIVMTHSALAGAATEKYKTVIDLPLLSEKPERPDPENEGKTGTASFSFKTMFDPAVGYPFAALITDKATAY